MKQGLYSNIKNKRDRIAAGSGEKMRKREIKVPLVHLLLLMLKKLLKKLPMVAK